jgi:predicted regulator of Ras-like GTPase activity (Roadblock/LC7/MglB family)
MFQEILQDLVVRSGARWAMIAGSDGILLETDTQGFRAEAESLAAEYAVCLRSARKAAGNTAMGAVLQTFVATERGKILFQSLNGDYFLALSLGPQSYAGKANFELGRITESLQKELSC